MEGSQKVSSRLKRQTLIVLIFGLIAGSTMVFTVVWSGTKQHMEQKKLEEAKKDSPQSETSQSSN